MSDKFKQESFRVTNAFIHLFQNSQNWHQTVAIADSALHAFLQMKSMSESFNQPEGGATWKPERAEE